MSEIQMGIYYWGCFSLGCIVVAVIFGVFYVIFEFFHNEGVETLPRSVVIAHARKSQNTTGDGSVHQSTGKT